MRWFESSRPSIDPAEWRHPAGITRIAWTNMTEARHGPREHLDELIGAWHAGDALRAAAHFTEDGAYAEAGRAPIVGRAALVAHFTRFFRDGPRWRLELDDLIIDGLRAAVVYRFAVEGARSVWHERAGCALVTFDAGGAIAAWREYEG